MPHRKQLGSQRNSRSVGTRSKDQLGGKVRHQVWPVPKINAVGLGNANPCKAMPTMGEKMCKAGKATGASQLPDKGHFSKSARLKAARESQRLACRA